MNADISRIDEEKFHKQLHADINKPIDPYITTGASTDNPVTQHNGAHKLKWAVSTIDVKRKTIRIQVYLHFSVNDLSELEFARLKQLAINGINKYWSRSIRIDGEKYNVTINASHRKGNAIKTILSISDDSEYANSFNPGGFVRARFIFNRGYFKKYGEFSTMYAEKEFMAVSAHEFGHSILLHAGGERLSWGHKGSTGVYSQQVKKSTPGYPLTGEVDLMKYYDDEKSTLRLLTLLERSIAAPEDIKRLIWGSKLIWMKE